MLLGAMLMTLADQGAASSINPIIEIHDFSKGPAAIRRSLAKEWTSNGEFSFHYQSYGCISAKSLSENDGRRDERPVEISKIKLLGRKNVSKTDPVYLVEGTRSVWISRNGSASSFETLPYTWLVTFNGNNVNAVREARELHYLFSNNADD
jgi:hypothetical protein